MDHTQMRLEYVYLFMITYRETDNWYAIQISKLLYFVNSDCLLNIRLVHSLHGISYENSSCPYLGTISTRSIITNLILVVQSHDDVIKWIKIRVTGHLCGEFTVSLTKDQQRGKCFNLMTSSWKRLSFISGHMAISAKTYIYNTCNTPNHRPPPSQPTTHTQVLNYLNFGFLYLAHISCLCHFTGLRGKTYAS